MATQTKTNNTLLLKNISMTVKISGDNSYDLRGASEREVGEAIDHYFDNTSSENNVFLINESEGLIGRLRERLGDLIDDIKLFFYR